MPWNIRLLTFVLFLSIPLAAQTISPAPAAGDPTVTIVTAPAATGATIAIFSAATAATCSASATSLALAPNTGKTVLGGQTQTAVTLATPLTSANAYLCAVLTDPDKKTTHTAPAVAVGPAAPLPASTKPIVAPGQGTPLPVVSTVNQSVRIDAVLIPSVVSQRIFGKEVSQHYAAVQIIIANHNQDAAFILESTAMDHTHWLFSNNFQLPAAGGTQCAPSAVTSVATNTCNQIASMESRTVRSELEDAQVWSRRNTIVRLATLVGTIASSYVFLAGNTDYTTGVGNYTGQVVPALNAFYPDRSQAQINNISDFGFKTPHVIPKASSDIIVAFFPIADFLTPDLRKLFLKSPAVFAVPGEMLIDAKLTPTLTGMLESAGVIDQTQLKKDLAGKSDAKSKVQAEAKQISTALGDYERMRAQSVPNFKPTDADPLVVLSSTEMTILTVLQKASINNISILVDGIMTVDVNAVPASVKSASISDDTTATTWTSGSTVKGTLSGSFLSGGTVTLAKSVTGVPTDITVDTKTSTDSTLSFSFTLTGAIVAGTELDFVVSKKASDGSTTSSSPFAYTVPASAPAPASASTAAPDAAVKPAVTK